LTAAATVAVGRCTLHLQSHALTDAAAAVSARTAVTVSVTRASPV